MIWPAAKLPNTEQIIIAPERSWVQRVPYPIAKIGFQCTYEHILPDCYYEICRINEDREAITLFVYIKNGTETILQEFWAGNFTRGSEPILVNTKEYYNRFFKTIMVGR